MAVIFTSKQPWLKRPTGRVEINLASPQANGLVLWVGDWVASRVLDQARNATLTGTGVTIVGDAELGGLVSQYASGSTSNYVVSSAPVTAAPLTFTAWFRVNDVTSSYEVLSLAQAAADTHYFALEARGSDANDPVAATARGGGSPALGNSNGLLANTWTHGAAVFLSATSRTGYRNGVPGTPNTTSITPSTINKTGIGYLAKATPAAYLNGAIADARIYNRALSDEEVRQQYDLRTRWELYAPAPSISRFFLNIAGGSNETVTPTAGTLTVTGATPVRTVAHTRTPTLAALVATGAAPVRLVAETRAPTKGAATLTGATPSVIAGTVRAPALAALVVAGATPVRLQADTRTPTKGAAVLSGATPVVASGLYTEPAKGAVVIAGATPIRTVAELRAATKGAIVISGATPGVAITTSAQYGYPVADIAAGGWTPSTGVDLYAMVDEHDTADDGDYISSGATPVNDLAMLQLTPLSPPATGTVTLHVRTRWVA